MHLKFKLLRRSTIAISLLILGLFVLPSTGSLAEIRVFFCPNGGAAEEIIRQIDAAKSYINIAMYSFTSEPIAEAVGRAKERKIKIRILMDRQQAAGVYSKYQYFLDNDIDVITDIHAGIMHNKIAIIDGRVLFTGSFNWTKSAEKSNEENLLEFIDEEEIIGIYQERFNYLWEYDQPRRSDMNGQIILWIGSFAALGTAIAAFMAVRETRKTSLAQIVAQMRLIYASREMLAS